MMRPTRLVIFFISCVLCFSDTLVIPGEVVELTLQPGMILTIPSLVPEKNMRTTCPWNPSGSFGQKRDFLNKQALR